MRHECRSAGCFNNTLKHIIEEKKKKLKTSQYEKNKQAKKARRDKLKVGDGKASMLQRVILVPGSTLLL